MFGKLFNFLFTILGVAVGGGIGELIVQALRHEFVKGVQMDFNPPEELTIALISAFIFGIIFNKLTPLFRKQSKKAADDVMENLQDVSINDILASVAGLIIGLIIAYLLSKCYESSLQDQSILLLIINLASYIVFGYLGVVIGSRKGKEIFGNFISPKGKGGRKSKVPDSAPKILDTSVIIDGRIAEIMKTGFLEGTIIIPEFVLLELQHIADSSDSLKRNRGRRGLDILNKIQVEHGIEIYNTAEDRTLEEIPEVDVKLLKLAQMMGGKVVTNDFNLNKVAHIKGVEVLNINELANTLKPVVLPGEEMEIFPVKEGKEYNQAVAYLDDGTMIVVEDGHKYIGQSITATVTSVLQTAAGRMIFVRPGRQGR